MTNRADFGELQQLVSILVNVLASVQRLPHGPERNAALKQVEEFQKRIEAMLIQRGVVMEGVSFS